jgi:HD superfamily phosphohydrolase
LLSALLRKLRTSEGGLPGSAPTREKIVRDPLHGFVELRGFEDDLLASPFVQRLSRVKQLAHSYIVFPSAVHTRLEHSLGTLYVAGRICEKLNLTLEQTIAVRAAALLHDVGHGPFSHVFEEVLRTINGDKFDHEKVTLAILDHDPIIRGVLGGAVDEVRAIIAKDRGLLSSIISGDLDADKMDYLRRDSYHTGVAYGVFDIERVLRCVGQIHDSADGRDYLVIEYKGMDALESYRLARYSMTRQVYEHHTRLAADDMFLRAVHAALEEGVLVRDDWVASNPDRLLQTYLRFDDSSIVEEIARNSHGVAKQLVEDIRNRRLLKTAYELPLTEKSVPDYLLRGHLSNLKGPEARKIEAEIATKFGIPPDFTIVHVQSSKIKLYERFDQSREEGEAPILVKRRDGSCEQMDNISPIHADREQIRQMYIFVPRTNVPDVRAYAVKQWGPSARPL